MAAPVRVRYAPSPTGLPHVGNLRSALFTWLFARHHGGVFILRIEDTDQARYDEAAEEAILESLDWLGLDRDEGPDVGGAFGPYRQSERRELYAQAARRLVDGGHAYYCYCSPQRLDQVRRERRDRHEPPGYDNHCREMGQGPADGAVIRFKMPLEGQTTCLDQIRGEVTWENRLLDDFIILKSDGFPTYHLASVMDDHAMEISHVLRADEWLASTPRHWRLYEALGYEKPVFAHLPVILGPDRAKLSKRHGAVSVFEYREQGYLPEAMVNFLALLGWSLDDRTEILSRKELVQHFSLERVGVSPAVFNQEKLEWMNGYYIRQLSLEGFTGAVLDYWEQTEAGGRLSREQFAPIAPLVQERTKLLGEVWGQVDFFVDGELFYKPLLLWAGMGDKEAQRAVAAGEEPPLPGDAPQLRVWLEAARSRLEELPAWGEEPLEQALRALAEELGVTTRRLFGVLRVATTGRTAAPPLFQTVAALGRDRTLRRIGRAVALLR